MIYCRSMHKYLLFASESLDFFFTFKANMLYIFHSFLNVKYSPEEQISLSTEHVFDVWRLRNSRLSTYKKRLPTIDVYKKESAAQFQSEYLLFKMIGFPRMLVAVYLSFPKKTIIFQKQNI